MGSEMKEFHGTLDEYLKLSKQGKICGIVGCRANPVEKCEICGAHYCKEHSDYHFHAVPPITVLEAEK